ncbi:bifunctional aminoglycoside phosphotransferase/ATP-binding protein [Phenylobacterium sp.]|uniref:bifunctional aminoglycoside phosphotransferase/ATP-binding protein n=1 Tax=Phenylobacterium sp. TaxID=1871053 RepID=UPI00272FC010|nr:bifunctional aminoglycoside phosphotransferase/ATP-binding protein [Phenylobacterium sp.]MDP1617259.1 AAA family ATPase [Phenylobacterium sp.]MDP1987331.1 AAA family ATPase [Phenylobacterium sp.]
MTDPEEVEVASWLEAQAERRIDTACARVFLTPERAFKIKRRVELGYLDYSTLELRRWALDRELRFNRAAAPDIYRTVRTISRTADGGLEFDGEGEPVEFALEMRRFDEHAVLAAQPWAVDGGLADSLGRTVASFHATAPLRPQGGGGRALKFTIDSNAHLLRELAPRLGAERVEAVVAATNEAFFRHQALLDARAMGGFARHCHGDLHLGNILLEDGRPILFDCIEFNDTLSDVDVQYDIAFLLMDLDFRRRRDAAVRVLSAYLDEAARSFGPELWDGLAALPLMLAVRAAVRAHVWAHSGDDSAASAYLDTALAHLSPPPPSLAAVGGLSGTGKSTFARLIAPGLGASPGAVVLRTDEVRKRLMGVPPDSRLPASAYGPGFYEQVYDTLFSEAGQALAAGRAVVLDATFISPDQRGRAEALARRAGVPFAGIWLEAPAEILAARIGTRHGDASDATVETLQMQIDREVGDIAWTRVDASGPAAEAAEAWSHLQTSV